MFDVMCAQQIYSISIHTGIPGSFDGSAPLVVQERITESMRVAPTTQKVIFYVFGELLWSRKNINPNQNKP